MPLCRVSDCGRLIHLVHCRVWLYCKLGVMFTMWLDLSLCGMWYCEALVLLVGAFFTMQISCFIAGVLYYALCMRPLVLSVWWCILRCCMLPLLVCYIIDGKSLSVVLSCGRSLSFSRLGGVLLGLGSWIIFRAFEVSAGHQRFCWVLCSYRHLSGCCWRILCK